MTLLGRDVILEDGLVVTPAGKNRRAIWVQCPTCGPQPPATGYNKARGRDAIVYCLPDNNPVLSSVYRCPACGQDAPLKEILIPRDRKGSSEKCTNRCLDGKVFCACHCRGRCHSEGVCSCKEGTDDCSSD